MAYDWKTELPGAFSRHADGCPVRDGGECTCGPLGYRSSVREWETNKRTVSPLFETIHEALAWQRDQMISQESSRGLELGRGELGALVDEFLQAAEDGMARDASGAHYSRDSVRALRGALSYVDSELGTMDVQDVRRRHIQALLGQLRNAGMPPSRIVAVVDALHALYAYAIRRDVVGFSPLVELELPESTNGAATNGAAPSVAPKRQAAVEGEWTTADFWTAPPPVGDPWTPPPFSSPGRTDPEVTAPYQRGGHETGYGAPPPGAYGATPPGAYGAPPSGGYTTPVPGYTYGGYTAPYPSPNGRTGSGPLSAIIGAPANAADANYDATMQERWLWWTVRIIVIVFVLIALVLVAESV